MRRTPRWPSIRLNSCRASARSFNWQPAHPWQRKPRRSPRLGLEQELVQQRVEQADRHRQAITPISKDRRDPYAASAKGLARRLGCGVRPRCRKGSSRARRRCGPRRRTCARCGRADALGAGKTGDLNGVSRGLGVGAHLHAADLVGPAHPAGQKSPESSGRCIGTAPIGST